MTSNTKVLAQYAATPTPEIICVHVTSCNVMSPLSKQSNGNDGCIRSLLARHWARVVRRLHATTKRPACFVHQRRSTPATTIIAATLGVVHEQDRKRRDDRKISTAAEGRCLFSKVSNASAKQ